MRKSAALKIAVSPLVLGVMMVGCTTSQPSLFRPVAASQKEARTQLDALRNAGLARQAVDRGDFAKALTHAEKAVELSPRDAGYRMLLADLYLKNGRFLSAEAAYSDLLTLHPDNSRARFNLALAQIALGKQMTAVMQLDRLAETAAPSDIGLAYALAGQPERAIQLLEPAAREPGADAQLRQNLALAYALAGDWHRARISASQDLSPADVPARMEQWAAFVQPRTSYDQVASLLGVTPADDAGQPSRLALAPEAAPAPVAVAAAEPQPVEQASALAEAAPAPEAPAAPGVEEVRYAQAAEALVKVQPAAVRADVAPAAAPAPAPVPTFVPAKPAPERSAGTGRFVVQLAAYGSAKAAEQAWPRVQARFGLEGFPPVRATVSLPKGTFHRLSVGGFQTQAEAVRACGRIKAKGGTCFVRPVSGDVPIRYAMR